MKSGEKRSSRKGERFLLKDEVRVRKKSSGKIEKIPSQNEDFY
jgi:hypothetical protein